MCKVNKFFEESDIKNVVDLTLGKTMSKKERIAAERERLAALFADLDANQLQAAAGLISSAAFLRVTLEDLEAEINAAGCTEEYINGRDQSGVKVSAACQAYAQLNTKYQSTIQKLLKIVPPAPKKPIKPQAIQSEIDDERKAQIADYEAKRRKENEMFEAFGRAYPNDATPDNFKKFKAEWERNHSK